MQLSNLIRGVHRHVEDFIAQRIKDSGLSVEQYRVLEVLAQGEGRAMSALATAVFVDSPTLTKIVDRMVMSSLVYRAPDINDRRKVLIYTAQKGAQVFKGLSSIEEELRAHLAELLGPQQLELFARTARRILSDDEDDQAQTAAPAAGDTLGASR